MRIRDSEAYLKEKYPAVVRVRNARRIKRAAREILRCVEQLETMPAEWTATVLAYFEVLADKVIADLQNEAAAQPLH
jgi:hypothetical protein